MRKEELEQRLSEFSDQSGLNYVSKEEAIEPSLAGLRIYEAPLVGYASAEDTLFKELQKEGVVGPHLILPQEWLAGAKTVISYFLPFTQEVKKSNHGTERRPSNEWLHGRIEGQRFVLALDEYVKGLLMDAGYQAVIPAADPRFHCVTAGKEQSDFTSNWSERHAAYICGLGTFGLSKGLITKKGIAGRFGSVITDAPLEADMRPYTGIYDYCTGCGACIRRCPADAISKEYGKNHIKCSAFLRETKEQFAPRLGCGKCQTMVPCENQIPNPEFRKN